MKRPPDRETWRSLLRPALRIVDSLVESGYGELDFTLGGGTALMFQLDHRISKDIDLFVHDAQAIGFLSPRLNAIAAEGTRHYQEQANSVKIVLAEGDIDFIAAGTIVSGEPRGLLEFEGRSIAVDPTSEILAKKMLYRAETFKARDVFDLNATIALAPAAAWTAIKAAESVRPALLRRLRTLARLDPDGLTADILVTEAGRPHAENMILSVIDALESSDPPGEAGR